MTLTTTLDRLNAHIHELEAELVAARRRIAELEQLVAYDHAMLHAIPALVYLKDREHRYMFGNQAFMRHLIVPVDELKGQTDSDIFPPEVAAACLEDDERVMASGVPSMGVELPVRRPDGTIGWVAHSAVPYTDASGEVIGLVGMVIDITDRKLAEEALRRSQIERQVLLDTIPAMIYLKDREHRYVMGNRQFADSAGITVSEVPGKTDADLFLPVEAQSYVADDERVMVSGRSHVIEESMTMPNGERVWLATYKVPFRNEDHDVTGMVGIALDITDRKQAEEALRRSQAEQRALIEQQQQLLHTIRVLSTPVLPISDRTLVLPLVGEIDTTRSRQIVEALLDSVQRHNAEWVIIDITGVPLIDTAVANHLIQATRGVALLGAGCILAGVSPELAQTIVGLGIDLGSLQTSRDLRSALALVMRRSRR